MSAHTTVPVPGDAPGDAPGATTTELAITGMTCASCANRIERKLNKLDGVSATVNYATEKAKVSYPGTVSTDDLLRTVEAAGYAAALPAPPAAGDGPDTGGTEQEVKLKEASDAIARLVRS